MQLPFPIPVSYCIYELMKFQPYFLLYFIWILWRINFVATKDTKC